LQTNLFVNFPIENERGEMDWKKSLQKIEYWLVALSGGLVLLHLTLIDKSQNENLFSTATLTWLTIGSLLWDRRKKLILESDTASTFVGMVLVVLVEGLPELAGEGMLCTQLLSPGTRLIQTPLLLAQVAHRALVIRMEAGELL
jgi:hypothetical protein